MQGSTACGAGPRQRIGADNFIRQNTRGNKSYINFAGMRYLTAILFGLLAAGCGDKAADNLMTQASVLIEEHPDSALLALRQIDPSAISPAADARRRLLLAQTYSRTGAETDNDSLTAPALDYYERHGSGAERAYAWYFDAKVHHNAGDLGRAIKGYTQAMLYAERNRDKAGTTKLLMALYHTLGLLYLEQGYDTEAEDAFSKAVAAAQETGSAELEGYSRYMLSSAQYANGRYAEAIETLSPLVGARDTMAFRFFAQQITLQNLIYHTFAEDWSTGQLLEERARIDMHELWTAPLTHGPASADDDDRTLYDIASAIIFYRAEQPDSAQYYIDRSLAHIKRFNQNNIGLYTIASAIHHRRGEDGKAYACAMQYIGKRDSLDKARQGVSVAELEKRYRTANETALREAGLRYRIWIATLACLLLAAAVTGAVVGYRRKLRHRDAQLSEYLTLLESYRESHDSLTSRLDASNEREAAARGAVPLPARHRRNLLHLWRRGTAGEEGEGAGTEPGDARRHRPHGRPLQRPGGHAPAPPTAGVDAAQLRFRSAGRRRVLGAGDQRDARHDAERGLHAQIETQTPDRRIGGSGQGVFHPFFRIARAPGAPARIRGIALSVNQHFTHKQARIIPYRQAASGLNFAGKLNEKTKQSYETDISFTRMRPGAFFRETDLRANCAGEGGRPGAATRGRGRGSDARH